MMGEKASLARILRCKWIDYLVASRLTALVELVVREDGAARGERVGTVAMAVWTPMATTTPARAESGERGVTLETAVTEEKEETEEIS